MVVQSITHEPVTSQVTFQEFVTSRSLHDCSFPPIYEICNFNQSNQVSPTTHASRDVLSPSSLLSWVENKSASKPIIGTNSYIWSKNINHTLMWSSDGTSWLHSGEFSRTFGTDGWKHILKMLYFSKPKGLDNYGGVWTLESLVFKVKFVSWL